MQIFATCAELLERLEETGRPIRVLGHAPDGSPLVAVRVFAERYR